MQPEANPNRELLDRSPDNILFVGLMNSEM